MFTDPVATTVLGILCLFPAAMVVHFGSSEFRRDGLRFRPVPVTPQRVLLLVLTGVAVYIGWAGGNSVFLWFVGLSTLALAIQHTAAKRWVDGKVRGLWFRPLGIRGLEADGNHVVLVLELGYRLAVPKVAANEAFLAALEPAINQPSSTPTE